MFKRYTVVVVGLAGSSAAQRSEISHHRRERDALASAAEERDRLTVAQGVMARNYRVVVERDGVVVEEFVPEVSRETPTVLVTGGHPADARVPGDTGEMPVVTVRRSADRPGATDAGRPDGDEAAPEEGAATWTQAVERWSPDEPGAPRFPVGPGPDAVAEAPAGSTAEFRVPGHADAPREQDPAEPRATAEDGETAWKADGAGGRHDVPRAVPPAEDRGVPPEGDSGARWGAHDPGDDAAPPVRRVRIGRIIAEPAADGGADPGSADGAEAPRRPHRLPTWDEVPSGPVPDDVLRYFESAVAREERRRLDRRTAPDPAAE